MNAAVNNLTIGALATGAGVNVETVRFYQRKGLLPAPSRPQGGIRRYGAADLGRLKFVKSSQRLGFSLDEAAGLLQLEDGTHCGEARRIATEKLLSVRARLADLRKIESALSALVRQCGSNEGSVSCPLIDAIGRQ